MSICRYPRTQHSSHRAAGHPHGDVAAGNIRRQLPRQPEKHHGLRPRQLPVQECRVSSQTIIMC